MSSLIVTPIDRIEHIRMHEKHRGHESMHAEMVLILFATLVISQIALVKWKQIYPRSYHVREIISHLANVLKLLS